MNRVQSILQRFPPWILSTITLTAILWLTLAPRPLGDLEPPLFPGADKIAHALMFGGLECMICLDRCRSRNWEFPKVSFLIFTVIGVSLTGLAIEFLQQNMNLGRSGDLLDFVADSIGAILAAIAWYLFSRFHDKRND